MERRRALAALAGTVAGLVSLPAWATGWTPETLPVSARLLSRGQSDLLAEVVETIIPTTDTPGAKALGIHEFVERVVADCYDPKRQNVLTTGLAEVYRQAHTTFGKGFADGDATQRTALLTQMAKSENPAQKDFMALVKNLTIKGYLNSEYVMTNLTHFELVPGRYHGCVPVPAQTATSSTAK